MLSDQPKCSPCILVEPTRVSVERIQKYDSDATGTTANIIFVAGVEGQASDPSI